MDGMLVPLVSISSSLQVHLSIHHLLTISLLNYTLRFWRMNEVNDHQLKKLLILFIYSPHHHLRKCIENSMENIHTDVRV